jgi:hypothetical protein
MHFVKEFARITEFDYNKRNLRLSPHAYAMFQRDKNRASGFESAEVIFGQMVETLVGSFRILLRLFRSTTEDNRCKIWCGQLLPHLIYK